MKYLYIICLSLASNFVQAQNIFSEGKVYYDVYFDDDLKTPQGEFILTVKGTQFKREMNLSSGASNTTINNVKDGETISYNNINGTKYAQKLDAKAINKLNLKFDGAKYQKQPEVIQIANQTTDKYVVEYKDGKSNTVYVAQNITPQIKEINAMFSYLQGLPLRYEVYSGSKKIILIAREIKSTPIEVIEFLPLKGYTFMDKKD